MEKSSKPGDYQLMRFRLFENSDLAQYLYWVNQREIWEVDNPGPFEIRTAESFSEQWERIVGWQRSWIIESDGRGIGYIGFVSDERDDLTDEFFIVKERRASGEKAMAEWQWSGFSSKQGVSGCRKSPGRYWATTVEHWRSTVSSGLE